MDTITVAGASLSLAPKYAEGDTITALEAKALNQTRAENIGNNLRKRIAALGTQIEVEGKKVLQYAEDALASAQVMIEEAAASYQFNVRKVGSGPRVTDPIAKIAMSLARDIITKKLVAQGKTWAAVSKANPEGLKAKQAEFAARPDVRADAEKLHKARQKTLAGSDDGMDLGDLA